MWQQVKVPKCIEKTLSVITWRIEVWLHQGRGPVERRLFELATQDEIDKLRTNDGSDSKNSDEELQLDDLEVRYIFELEME